MNESKAEYELPNVRVKGEGEITNIQHRSDRIGSNFGAYFNIIGKFQESLTDIHLQLPYSLKQGGWIGVGIMVLSAIIAIYSGHLLIRCLYYNGVNRLESYPAIGQAAFGRFGKITVQLFHYSILIGTSCIYIMLTGLNAQSMTQQLGVDLSLKLWITIAAIIAWVPFIALKTLREVAFLSIFGVLATVVVIVVTVVLGLLDLPRNMDKTHDAVVLSGLPVALASISFSFGGNVIYAHVEKSMKNPEQWTKILSLSVGTILVMYLVLGIPGYYVYGNATTSPILDNLPTGAALNVAKIMITIHVIIAAPLMMTTFANEVESMLNFDQRYPSKIREFTARLGLRTLIVICVALIAMNIPYFADFMSLIGALSNCMIVFVLPVVFYLKLYGWRSVRIWELIWCLFIIIIGFIGCVLGAKDAIEALKANFASK
ncbi:hypothetical protein K7432_005782 [Basidiobolus ranarum]|uniref:Amino acid transporter transmembrane domain-containing protein n=1 Tax=Basidiobolus ranarum TaxID=34480 RepID=A0ABR2W2K8_9FUNG